MKKKHWYFMLAGVVLIGLFFFALRFFHSKDLPTNRMVDYRSEEARRAVANVKARSDSMRSNGIAIRMPHMVGGFVPGMPTNGEPIVSIPETNEPLEPVPVIDPKFSNPTNWPDDPRPEAKTFHQFAKRAHLYNLEPRVTYDKDEDFPHFRKAVGTTTHEAQMDTRNNRIVAMYSYRDRSASMSDYPGVTDDWANATGRWHERQMVEETFRILRELGPTYLETLKAVSQGRHEFKPEAWRVKLPEGGFKIVYPFATVKLFGPNVSGDPNEPPRVTAQYRMGPDGPVGLVDWYSLH